MIFYVTIWSRDTSNKVRSMLSIIRDKIPKYIRKGSGVSNAIRIIVTVTWNCMSPPEIQTMVGLSRKENSTKGVLWKWKTFATR